MRTLRNAVERDRVHHAYLFVGSRGTGKTSLAKILARSLNCVNGPTADARAASASPAVTIAAGTSLDVIEMDAASNRSVDDIRDLRERVGYAPAAGRWKVYILDEAHMLTREAWNAFLKTLEEPPPNTVFVLATTEPHKVMPTIVDRCQRFDFQRPSLEQIAEVVRRVAAAEEIEIDDGAVGGDRPRGHRQLPRRARHPRPARRLRRQAGRDRRRARGARRRRRRADPRRRRRDRRRRRPGRARGRASGSRARAATSPSSPATCSPTCASCSSIRTIGEVARRVQRHRRRARAAARPGRGDLRPRARPRDRRALRGAGRDPRGRRAADDARAGAAALRAARSSTRRARRWPSGSSGSRRRLAAAGGAPPRPRPSRAGAAAATADCPAADRPEPADRRPSRRGRAARRTPRPPRRPRRSRRSTSRSSSACGRRWSTRSASRARSCSRTSSRRRGRSRSTSRRRCSRSAFRASAAFNKRKAEAQEARDRLADAVQTIVGERLRPVYVLLEGERRARRRRRPSSARTS